MTNVNWRELASVIPLKEDEKVFHYNFTLDGAFKPLADLNGFIRVPVSSLPYQFTRSVYKKNNEEWTVGFNLYQNGDKLEYQSFFYLGNPPSKEYITNKGDFDGAGPVGRLNEGNANSVARVPKYNWLTCSIKPMDIDFSLEVVET